jgi:hypothetical protein
VTLVAKLLQDSDKFGNIAERQSSGGLVKDVDGVFVWHSPQFACEFDTLRLTSRKGGGRLTQSDIAKTNGVKSFQCAVNFSVIFEEGDGFGHWHFQDIVDVSAAPFDLQAFACVSLSITHIAGNPHVGKEVHFQFDGTAAAASFAPSAFHVEAELARLVAALLGEFCVCKQGPDFIKHLGVRGGIGTGRPTNWRLVDDDGLVNMLYALKALMAAWYNFSAVDMPLQGRCKNTRNQ